MNEKILVVDDEKEIADLLEVYLKNDNYIVHKYSFTLFQKENEYKTAERSNTKSFAKCWIRRKRK